MKGKLILLILSLIAYGFAIGLLASISWKIFWGVFLFVLANNLSASAGRMK